MTKINAATQSKGEVQVRAIFENPGLNNKQVALVCREAFGPKAGDLGEKTVAWYRSHAKKGTLGKSLMAVVNELGDPARVPSAAGNNSRAAPAPAREMTLEEMASKLREAGHHVAEPAQEPAE